MHNQILHSIERHAFCVPSAVMQKIPAKFPKSMPMTFEGHGYTVLPDTLDTCRTLARYGVNAPTPILWDYNWPGHFTPFDHQKITADFMCRFPRSFIFNDIGTSKTMTVLWATDYLRKIGALNRLLISGPLSILESVWADALWMHFPHLTFQIVYGSRKQRMDKLAVPADVYIINHDGVKILSEEINKRPDINGVVIDESAVVRNKSTEMWQKHKDVAGVQTGRALWCLTGSPCPNAPTDLFAQAKLVNPLTVPKYFSKFRDIVMYQDRGGGLYAKWIPRPNWEKTVYHMIRPSIRFKREECTDLPPVTTITKKIAMSPEQNKAYDDLIKRFVAELESGTITAANEGAKMMKLLQVATGCVYGEDKSEHPLPCEPKLRELISSIYEAGGKAVVISPFRHSQRLLQKVLSKLFRVRIVNASTGRAERTEIFRNFQMANSSIDVILAVPGCLKYGVDLTKSSSMIWFGPVYDFDIYNQTCGRITRPGQMQPQTIIHLVASKAEEIVYRKLAHKEKTQGSLLELLTYKGR